MEEVDKEISEMKLSLNARARIVAESYLTAVRVFLHVMREMILISNRLMPRNSFRGRTFIETFVATHLIDNINLKNT